MIAFQTFLEQRAKTSYSFVEHYNLLRQFKFILQEAKFSEAELISNIAHPTLKMQLDHNVDPSIIQKQPVSLDSCLNNFKQYQAKNILIFGIPIPIISSPASSLLNSYLFKAKSDQIDPNLLAFFIEPKTHIGIQAIQALRSSFNSIYGAKRNSLDTQKENINNNIEVFFSICASLPMEKMDNIYSLAFQCHFGKNALLTYHQSLILLASHNFTDDYQQQFIELIDKVVPDGSIHDLTFAQTLASVIFPDTKVELFNLIAKKFPKELWTVGSITQHANHRNFYHALKDFVFDYEKTFAYLEQSSFVITPPEDKVQEYLLNNIAIHLNNTGMLNNKYYNNIFASCPEVKQQFADMLEEINPSNSFIHTMIKCVRPSHIDYGAFVYKNILTNKKMFLDILIKIDQAHGKFPVQFFITKFKTFSDSDFTELSKDLTTFSPVKVSLLLNDLSAIATKEQLLILMMSSSTNFAFFEKFYQEKKLLDLMHTQDNLQNKPIAKDFSLKRKI